ncbi:RNA chaperone Hfq [bacterium]|nr:MAG: RNA chaperone Hfq [bacterium]
MGKAINLQDMFLNQVRKEGVPVQIYLNSSVQLRGTVRGFDAFTILIDQPGKPTGLVYKHAVASIVPARSVSSYKTAQEIEAERASREGEPGES